VRFSQRNAELERENAELERENEELRRELSRHSKRGSLLLEKSPVLSGRDGPVLSGRDGGVGGVGVVGARGNRSSNGVVGGAGSTSSEVGAAGGFCHLSDDDVVRWADDASSVSEGERREATPGENGAFSRSAHAKQGLSTRSTRNPAERSHVRKLCNDRRLRELATTREKIEARLGRVRAEMAAISGAEYGSPLDEELHSRKPGAREPAPEHLKFPESKPADSAIGGNFHRSNDRPRSTDRRSSRRSRCSSSLQSKDRRSLEQLQSALRGELSELEALRNAENLRAESCKESRRALMMGPAAEQGSFSGGPPPPPKEKEGLGGTGTAGTSAAEIRRAGVWKSAEGKSAERIFHSTTLIRGKKEAGGGPESHRVAGRLSRLDGVLASIDYADHAAEKAGHAVDDATKSGRAASRERDVFAKREGGVFAGSSDKNGNTVKNSRGRESDDSRQKREASGRRARQTENSSGSDSCSARMRAPKGAPRDHCGRARPLRMQASCGQGRFSGSSERGGVDNFVGNKLRSATSEQGIPKTSSSSQPPRSSAEAAAAVLPAGHAVFPHDVDALRDELERRRTHEKERLEKRVASLRQLIEVSLQK